MAWANEGIESGEQEPAATLRRAIERHAAALELYARQLCDEPEDAVQEAFIRFARQRCPPRNTAAWLYRVVRRLALSGARSNARRKRHESAAGGQRQAWFIARNGQSLDAESAARALRDLPQEQREVVVAHLWGGLTFEQAGELVGCSASAAHRRYLAALRALREKLA